MKEDRFKVKVKGQEVIDYLSVVSFLYYIFTIYKLI